MPAALGVLRPPRALLAAPLVVYLFYTVIAALARVPFLAEAPAGQHPAPIVRGATAVALVLGTILFATWRRTSR